MKLRAKLSLFPIVLAILVLLVSLIFTLKIPNNIINNQTRNHLISNAQSRANNVETFLKNYTSIVHVLSVGSTFMNSLDPDIDSTKRISEVNYRIKRTLNSDLNIFRIKVLDKNGIVIASSKDECGMDLCEKPEFTAGRDSMHIGEIHKSKFTGNLVLGISAPIYVREKFSGVLVVNFEVEEQLFDIMTNRIGLGETEEIYLVNKDGYMITPSNFVDDAILNKKITTDQVNLCIMEHIKENYVTKMEEIPTEYHNYTGRKVLGTHRYIPEMQWGVIAEFDINEVNRPIKENIILVITIFMVLLTIILIAGILISRNTIRQIIKLQRGTEEITNGNLDYKIGIVSNDEIGLLSSSFNEMTGRLKEAQNKLRNYTEDLESKVLVRTAELKKQFEKSEKQRIANLVIMKNLNRRTKELGEEIIERKLAEVDLSKSEYKFRLLANNTYEWEYWINPKGEYVFLSKSCERITGYSSDDFFKNPELFFELVHPDYVKMVKSHYHSEEEKHLPVGKIEFPLINRNGDDLWIEHNCSPVFDENGDFRGRRGNNRDITGRKLAEKKISNAHKRLEELYLHQDDIKENERKAVSREIHDELGQLLTALKIDLGWTKDNVEKNSDVKKKIKGMIATVSETIKTVQRISSDLRPGLLDDLGLVAAIEWYCQEFEQRTQIQCHLKSGDVKFIDERKNLAIYRILQEGLTNVIRHANAKNVNVNLHEIDDSIILEIIDDGVGMKKEKIDSHKSLGLIGISERVKQHNGVLEINSEVDNGTKLRILIPVNKKIIE